ncbi:MAG: carboxypeptidase-like regulatory domain-containing protein, partial [Bacteroidales bacterium]
DSELTSFYYHPADSKTQFSPFILKNGEPETIHYIILDKKPLYFRWAGTTGNQYSFEASPGYHLLELRTSERKFVIDSIYLAPGMKLVLAVKDMMHPASYSAVKEKNVLSETEKKSLGKWMFSYRNNFEGYLAYMKQDNRIFLLNGTGGMSNSYNGYSRYDEESLTNVAGPVSSSSATLVVPAKYKVEFTPEAGYSNEFSAGLLKMRSISMYDKLPSKLTGYPVERFTDLPLSEEMMNRMHADDMYKKKMATAKFTIPSITAPGYCYLQLEFDSTFRTAGREPVLILVIPNSDLDRMSVFPGNTRAINNQQPGLTSIILWYRDDSHLRYDSIMLKRDGKNYVRLTWSDKRIPPDEGVLIKEKIEARIFSTGREPDPAIVNSWKANLTKQYLLTNLGPGTKVSGTVTSDEGPVPGAVVQVKGTDYGTLTDINGNYSINLPEDIRTLVFSFIGYKSEEVEVTSDVVNVMMYADVMALQEVVVVGYGIMRKRDVTGAVSVVSALSGKVAGVQAGSPGSKDKILIRGNSSFGELDQPLVIIDGIPYTGDLSTLDPNFIRDIKVLKDESLTSLYGSRASNGVILISTSELKKAGKPIPAFITEFIKMQFPEGEEQGTSGIRSFFRDYAYWKPDLVTNENGAASFIAKFPDDVTSWNSYFLVMKGKKSGSHTASVKSYKSLMAQLFVPRFLVEGDSSGLVGKVLNYSSDTVKLKTIFELDNKQVEEKERTCTKSLVDTLEVIAANTDTIIARYYFKKTDGYSDGEERKVPVFKRGIEKTVGEFIVLEGDTAITVKPGKGLGKVSVYAQSDAVGIIKDEIRYLEDYRYNCNEQLASKLIALVSSGKIARSAGKRFNGEQGIRRIIKTLESNANDDGAWGWWNRSGTADWVSIHVIEALLEARKEGYKVAFRTEDLLSYVVWTLESSKDKALNLHLLYIAKLSGFKLDYNKYIDQIDSQSLKALADKFLLIRLRQLTGLKYDTGIIYKNSYSTLFGNVAFGSEDNRDSFTDNRTQATINAYQVLAADSTVSRAYLSKIRNYFFECRRLGTWQNTYESARIIKTILPDLLSSSGGIITQPELAISGKVNTVIKKFPYEVTIDESDTLAIRKSGSFPVYLTYYQRYFENDPSPDSTSFTIRSSFADANLGMKAGKQEKLVVDLAVKRDAQFTVVEIPIPAGCTYDEKENYFEGAVHSEFHKDRVSVFYNFMKRGDYRFEISLLPRYTGSYTLNPAKAELMYFPVFSGNNELKQVQIK